MKILVVDDHALVRAGLCQVLMGLDPDEPTEVLQAGNCATALELAHFHPDLDMVLLDYQLPDASGLEALRILGQRHPELPVVILSGMANPAVMRQAMALGAAGFVTKSGQSDTLLHALRLVLQGEVYQEPEHTLFEQDFQHSQPMARQAPMLSPRQQEVLRLVCTGKTNRQIGELIGIGEETVKSHVRRIFRVLGAKTRTQAVQEARRWGYFKSGSAS